MKLFFLLAATALLRTAAEPLYNQTNFELSTCTADTGTGGCQLLGSSLICYKMFATTYNSSSGRTVVANQATANICWPSELQKETNSSKETGDYLNTTLTSYRYVTT